ncbi:hypothetical protein MJO28_007917, partial [Puccinia striiformis f. sp. tritici]
MTKIMETAVEVCRLVTRAVGGQSCRSTKHGQFTSALFKIGSFLDDHENQIWLYGRTFSGVGSNFAEGGFRHEVFPLLAPSGGRWLGDEWRVNCLIETGDLLKGSTRHEAVAQLEGRSELSSSSRLDPTAYCLGVLEESRARSINQP